MGLASHDKYLFRPFSLGFWDTDWVHAVELLCGVYQTTGRWGTLFQLDFTVPHSVLTTTS